MPLPPASLPLLQQSIPTSAAELAVTQKTADSDLQKEPETQRIFCMNRTGCDSTSVERERLTRASGLSMEGVGFDDGVGYAWNDCESNIPDMRLFYEWPVAGRLHHQD